MTYRDANGHFISKEEAERLNIAGRQESPEIEAEAEAELQAKTGWQNPNARPNQTVFIETGRNNSVEVPVGSPFQPTIERLAEDAHYGGYFRVYVNGTEVVNPEESPATVEADARISITSFDKVGVQSSYKVG